MDVETQAQSIAQFTQYLDELSLQDITPQYRRQATQRLTAFRFFLDTQPVSVYAAKKFLAYLRDNGYKPRSVEAYYHAIKPFLEFLGIPLKLKLRRPRQLPRYHSIEQLNSMLAAVASRSDRWSKLKQRDTLIILMLAFTGMRKSELMNLRPSDIANGFIYIRQGKGDKDRVIPLAQPLAKPLTDYINNQNISPSHRLFAPKSTQLYNIVKKYAMAAGIDDLSPHGLRHFFATFLVEQRAELRHVQELLGHESLATTAIYLDVIPRHLQSSIALLDASLSLSVSNTYIHKYRRRSRSKSLSLSLSNERKGAAACGSRLKRERPSMRLSISAQSSPLPSIGLGSEASYAWERDALIASPGHPKDGDTRPSSSPVEPQLIGNLESRQ